MNDIKTMPTTDNIDYLELIRIVNSNENPTTYFNFPQWNVNKKMMVYGLRSQLKIHGAKVIIGLSSNEKYLVITRV